MIKKYVTGEVRGFQATPRIVKLLRGGLFVLLMGFIVGKCQASTERTFKVRVTVYWKSGRGSDGWTRRGISATGKPLIEGKTVAVDPHVIPYGTIIKIPGYGTAQAVDTGSAVVDKSASFGKMVVVDLFFENRENAISWEHSNPPVVLVTLNRRS